MSGHASGERPVVETLLVVGVGLIGGSFALAARERGLVRKVVGVGRTRANLELAARRGIIDVATLDWAQAGKGAALVLLAVPVNSVVPSAKKLLGCLPEGAVVTDAGSVKGTIVQEMDELLRDSGLRFVGAHPIAGTERSGAGAAEADLFVGKRCVITPGATSSPEAIALVRGLWERVGMEVVEMPARVHDRILALVSHLPHMLAFALIEAAGFAHTEVGSPLGFAGTSFADATRVAASPGEMWRDICLANRDELLKAIDEFIGRLNEIRRNIDEKDAAGLEKLFAAARALKTGGMHG